MYFDESNTVVHKHSSEYSNARGFLLNFKSETLRLYQTMLAVTKTQLHLKLKKFAKKICHNSTSLVCGCRMNHPQFIQFHRPFVCLHFRHAVLKYVLNMF